MNTQELLERCYAHEESANHHCARALCRGDVHFAIQCNELAYRAVIGRYLISPFNRLFPNSLKERQKALDDLERIGEEYELISAQLNSNGGTA
mgnify:CR=1 FL=1